MLVADAHRSDGKRFVVHADEMLTAFLERESAIRAANAYSGPSKRTILFYNYLNARL